MLTALGRQIRKMRIDKGTSLKDMAEAFGVKSSFLSAIENGRKPIPEKLVVEIARYFDGFGLSLEQWKDLAERSKTRMTLDLAAADEFDRETCLVFGRNYLDLTPEQKQKIREMLDESVQTNRFPGRS